MQRQLTQTGAASPAGSGSSNPMSDSGGGGGGKSGSPPDKTNSGMPEGGGGENGKAATTGLWKMYLDALASQPVSVTAVQQGFKIILMSGRPSSY